MLAQLVEQWKIPRFHNLREGLFPKPITGRFPTRKAYNPRLPIECTPVRRFSDLGGKTESKIEYHGVPQSLKPTFLWEDEVVGANPAGPTFIFTGP